MYFFEMSSRENSASLQSQLEYKQDYMVQKSTKTAFASMTQIVTGDAEAPLEDISKKYIVQDMEEVVRLSVSEMPAKVRQKAEKQLWDQFGSGVLTNLWRGNTPGMNAAAVSILNDGSHALTEKLSEPKRLALIRQFREQKSKQGSEAKANLSALLRQGNMTDERTYREAARLAAESAMHSESTDQEKSIEIFKAAKVSGEVANGSLTYEEGKRLAEADMKELEKRGEYAALESVRKFYSESSSKISAQLKEDPLSGSPSVIGADGSISESQVGLNIQKVEQLSSKFNVQATPTSISRKDSEALTGADMSSALSLTALSTLGVYFKFPEATSVITAVWNKRPLSFEKYS